jgi:chromosome segregation ATPase
MFNFHRQRNIQVHIQRFADQELRKCRQLLSTSRLELKKTKKKLKEKEEQSSLAEEDIKRYTTENAKLQEKLKALTESISSL